MSDHFILDPRLAGDSIHVADLALCNVRLMKDARFAWLLLVPRQPALEEVDDLSAADQALLWLEVRHCSQALRTVTPCDKLNLGALGNIVRQLHMHVVARVAGDAAWPGPVWGSGVAEPYAEDVLETRVATLARQLARETTEP